VQREVADDSDNPVSIMQGGSIDIWWLCGLFRAAFVVKLPAVVVEDGKSGIAIARNVNDLRLFHD